MMGTPASEADTMKSGQSCDAESSRELLATGALGAMLAVSVAACNNQTGFSGSVGSTPNGPKLPVVPDSWHGRDAVYRDHIG